MAGGGSTNCTGLSRMGVDGAGTTRAAQAPDGNAQPQKGTYQIIYVGPGWGRVHNPHNSSGQRQGPKYVQAKTDMHCNETLGEIGSTRDYLQTSSARLVDGEGRVFVGVSSKIGRNVLCRG